MKKKIKIFIHPGYGKTGTTFLQETVFDKLEFVNLGKPAPQKDDLISDLIALQNKLFQPKYGFEKLYPVNYSYSVRNYAATLKKIIEKTDNENYILSDECLLDHFNYFGYFNLYLLKEIIEYLDKHFEMDIKFILSIRSQHEHLVATYAYDNFRMKKIFGSFNSFLNKVVTNKDLSEIYHFDLLIKKIKSVFNSEVLVLPLEELEQNHKIYLDRTLSFLNINIDREIFDNTFVNRNSKYIENEKVYNIRTLDFRSGLFNYLAMLHLSLKKYKIYENNFRSLTFIKSFLQPKTRISGKIKLNQSQIRRIQKHFEKSNKNTEKLTYLNLQSYHYY